MYHLIFASDSEPGDKIMSHLYAQALRQWPKMMEETLRRAGRAEQLPLFVDDEADATFAAKAYAYEPPIDPSAI